MAHCHALFATGPNLMQRPGSTEGPQNAAHTQREVFLTLGLVLGGVREFGSYDLC